MVPPPPKFDFAGLRQIVDGEGQVYTRTLLKNYTKAGLYAHVCAFFRFLAPDKDTAAAWIRCLSTGEDACDPIAINVVAGFAATREGLPPDVPFLRHIGIYAYRAGFLRRYTGLSRTSLEQAESLEQLRVLEHGYAIAARLTPEPFPPGIDTEADLQRAERWLARQA